ncbi:putative signal transducing protein [Lacinutrix iliipiscaria]|uniref:Signal transducing protein n=1 Tax=Lacinutrix iliipiscaria TaxID=1230532 RepID=A0ABW5WT08_9FLAO
MEESNYIKIYTGNFIITQLIVDKLQAIGINPVIKDETESARLGGFGTFNQGTQEIYVNNDELDAAVPIVESVTAEMQA